MGVGLVINFRQGRSETALEKRQVESLGMEYIGIPWSAQHKPSNAEVAEFLEAVRSHPGTKIFVHCRRGADRTGVMIAAYRVAVEHEKVANAISEMHEFHFDSFWHPQLAHYVKSLLYLLQNGGVFKSLAPAHTRPPVVSP
jgi:tyrosine-protein phosphatase SIW14